MKLKVKRIGDHSLPLPKYETDGASGFDLRAVVEWNKARWEHESGTALTTVGRVDYVVLPRGERISLPCGFAFEVPSGHELQVRPRSGLSSKGIVGTLGTVDSDYRGEVRVILTNMSGEDFTISNGDRIAQGVVAPVVRAEVEEAEALSETVRGGNGFGSTGTK